MSIVTNGRRTQVVNKYESNPPRVRSRAKFECRTSDGGKQQLHVYKKPEDDVVLKNMALVRMHFGTNVSDTLRLALHLTAQAIRANKAHVEVP